MPASRYVRKRPSFVRALWGGRKVIALLFVLCVLFWFVWANGDKVSVAFPFGLGTVQSGLGVVILASATVGGLATALLIAAVWTTRRWRSGSTPSAIEPAEVPILSKASGVDELPPPGYAARTPEGFSGARWS